MSETHAQSVTVEVSEFAWLKLSRIAPKPGNSKKFSSAKNSHYTIVELEFCLENDRESEPQISIDAIVINVGESTPPTSIILCIRTFCA